MLGVKELKVFEGHMDWNLNLSMTSALPVQWIHRCVQQHFNTMSDGWFIRRRVLFIPPLLLCAAELRIHTRLLEFFLHGPAYTSIRAQAPITAGVIST
jgi:hypothetical protein